MLVLLLSSRKRPPVDLALEIVRVWLATEFAGGRHSERIRQIELTI